MEASLLHRDELAALTFGIVLVLNVSASFNLSMGKWSILESPISLASTLHAPSSSPATTISSPALADTLYSRDGAVILYVVGLLLGGPKVVREEFDTYIKVRPQCSSGEDGVLDGLASFMLDPISEVLYFGLLSKTGIPILN
jgi:hypothetical protein